jgi:hypothetical protein
MVVQGGKVILEVQEVVVQEILQAVEVEMEV